MTDDYSIREQFEKLQEQATSLRVETHHPLEACIALDLNGNRCLLFRTPTKAALPKSTKAIGVSIHFAPDSDSPHLPWVITFTLLNSSYSTLFFAFCRDMISMSSACPHLERGADLVFARYLQWQKMLRAHSDGLLEKYQIQGLLGELLFLKDLISHKGGEFALNSWLGPSGSDRDFSFDTTWVEVKTVTVGKTSVEISSLEQLDAPTPGQLVVFLVEETSIENNEGITLNSIIRDIKSNFACGETIDRFDTKLLQAGYCERKEYDQVAFLVREIRKYEVDSGFPCLRRKTSPASVERATYSINLQSIKQFEA